MDRVLDSFAHVAALTVGVVASVLVGQPIGWIGFLVPLGPLLLLLAGRRAMEIREAFAFSLVIAVMVGGGWLVTELRAVSSAAAWLFPLGLLSFLFGLVNFVLVSISRARRSWIGLVPDYPWIPDRLASALGLDVRMH